MSDETTPERPTFGGLPVQTPEQVADQVWDMLAAPEPQRAAFEAWLMAEHLLDATWNAERNCYDEFPAHLAWKAWRAAWCCQQARSGAMELASKANELREAVQAGASTSDAPRIP